MVNQKSAVSSINGQNVFANNKIQNGDTSNGTNWAMAYFGGGGESRIMLLPVPTHFRRKGHRLSVNIFAGGGVFSGNTITNCDAIGVQSQNSTTVIGNYVSTIGSAAERNCHGRSGGRVISNYVTGSGASNVGIYSTTTSGAIAENYIVNTGRRGPAFTRKRAEQPRSSQHPCDERIDRGTEAQIGIDALWTQNAHRREHFSFRLIVKTTGISDRRSTSPRHG